MLGLINQDAAPAGSFPEVRAAARVAARFVNRTEDGIDGRPLRLVACAADGTPEGSAACARRMVDVGAVAVVGGVDFATTGSLPVLAAAGIPYLGGVPLQSPELTAPNSFQFTGGPVATYPGIARYLLDTGAKRVGVLVADLPTGAAAAATLLEGPLRRAGVEVTSLAVPAGTSDFAPALGALTAAGPDAIVVMFAEPDCSRVMRAAGALAVKARMLYPGSCATPRARDAGGSGAAGAYFATDYLLPDARDPQARRFRAEMRRRDATTEGSAIVGFAGVVNAAALMREVGAEALTPAALTAATKATRDHPAFMSHEFGCAGPPVAVQPAVCNVDVRIVQERRGQLVERTDDWINGRELLAP